jgi:RHS repeat-associated protein
VRDNVADAAYADDIDNQGAGNYTYDAIGNLVSDAKDSISNIQWNVYGKIMEIQRIPSAARPVSNIRYSYDAAGNRIGKRVAKYNSTAVDYTWYVRDASGNVMGTYGYTSTGTNDLSGANLMQNEVYLYGSGRLGALAVNRNVEDTLQPRDSSLSLPLGLDNLIKRPFVRGIKQYELTNHLGNVLVTISDRKLGVDDGTYDSSSVTGLLEKINGTKDGKVDWYVADVVTAGDYYPFGMGMPGRRFSAADAKYRYGFNGKENDNDVKGVDGGQQDYGMRIYDPRLGRFLSVDPIADEFPWNSVYAFAEGDPINYIDLDGLEKTAKPASQTMQKPAPVLDRTKSNTYVRPDGTIYTRPLPVSRSTPPSTANYENATRVEGGWYVTTPNGGYTVWDEKKKPLTFVPYKNDYMRRQETLQKESNEGVLTMQKNAVGENVTPLPKPITLKPPSASPTNDPVNTNNEKPDEFVYRSGSFSDKTFTPRPGKDDDLSIPKAGLSTFTSATEAAKEGGVVQVLSVNRLRAMGFVLSYDGTHVSILPGGKNSGEKLKEWAATRTNLQDGLIGQSGAHPNTGKVQAARVSQTSVAKKKK